MGEVVNLKLNILAASLAKQFNAKGCVIVMVEGALFDVGFADITPLGLQDAGCAIIHVAFKVEEDALR